RIVGELVLGAFRFLQAHHVRANRREPLEQARQPGGHRVDVPGRDPHAPSSPRSRRPPDEPTAQPGSSGSWPTRLPSAQASTPSTPRRARLSSRGPWPFTGWWSGWSTPVVATAYSQAMLVRWPVTAMVARTAATIPQGERWSYEPKLDGFRCIALRPT